MSIRVAVFDDNASRREALEMLINASGNMQCVGVFADCRNAVRHVSAAEPDVILMDIDMPHVDGIEGIKHIRQQFGQVKILMQTVLEDNDKIFEAILAGADGYFLKQTTPERLLQGIHEVMEGGAPMTPAVAKKVLQFVGKRSGAEKSTTFNLTQRETEILKLLVDGYSYKLIAGKCHISYSTVNTHVVHIYEKLQVTNAAAAVSTAMREGLV